MGFLKKIKLIQGRRQTGRVRRLRRW